MPKDINLSKHLIADLLLSGFRKVSKSDRIALQEYYTKDIQLTPNLKVNLYVKVSRLYYTLSYAGNVKYIQKPISENSLKETLTMECKK